MQTALADERWIFVGQGVFNILFVCIELYLILSFGLIWIDIELRITQGSSLSCWFLRQSGGGFMDSLILFMDPLSSSIGRLLQQTNAGTFENWAVNGETPIVTSDRH
jgi:hypothetical protein